MDPDPTNNTDKKPVYPESVTHTLAVPYKTTTGLEVKQIIFRRPKVKDLRRATKLAENALDMEIQLLAIIAQPAMSPEELGDADYADYDAFQAILKGFKSAQSSN